MGVKSGLGALKWLTVSQPLTLLADSTDRHTQHVWVQIPAQPLLTVSYQVRHLTHSSLSLPNCQMGTILSRAHICLALRNGSKPSQGTCHEWMLLMLYFINFLWSRPRFQRIQIKLEATSICKVGTGRVEGPVSVGSRASRFWILLCPPNQRPKDHCLSPPTFILRGYKSNHLGRTHKGEFQGQGTRSRLLHWVERHRCKVQ